MSIVSIENLLTRIWGVCGCVVGMVNINGLSFKEGTARFEAQSGGAVCLRYKQRFL